MSAEALRVAQPGSMDIPVDATIVGIVDDQEIVDV